MNYGNIIKNCRMCDGQNLYGFLDLGFAPPSDAVLSKEKLLEPETQFPLKVLQCQNCGLTQLSYAVNPALLYGYQYKYESSMTNTGRVHFFSMAYSICQKFNLEKNSLVIDIGSNVGVLLEGFKRNGMKILGIDPAPEICEKANERGIETWQEFMNSEVASKIVSEKGKAKIITGTNIFAHIDKKDELMRAIDICLDEEGVFIVEAPYLVDLIDNLEYDTIYLEHLEYLSVKPLVKFFEKYSMELFDVERYEIHGKSIRFFVCRKGKYPVSGNVKKLLDLEEEKGIYKKEILDKFAEKVEEHKKHFIELLRDLKKQGKKIIGISSPAKGNTLLNYCKIDTELVDYITEKSIIKRGHYTPGMHIAIVGEEEKINDKADYGIIFAWNFANEIIKNNKNFSKKGGKFIIPISGMGIEIREYFN
ncbi:methyltransferase domain-containing protein [Candidatus Pacearchaeota archaeon]|nr:methyltransferase domain-containing protein [Candidatus Pacearchaeota archaeon]